MALLKQKTRISLCLISFLLTSLAGISNVFSQQTRLIDFTYPDLEGDFYVSGIVSFPPSAVKSEQQILIKSVNSDEEIPLKITVNQCWPDKSVLNAEICFVANFSQKQKYILVYGEEVKGKKRFTETAVLPVVSFFIGGSPQISEDLETDVGQINILVDRSPQVYYYGHIVPLIVLIIFSYLRYRRVKSLYES